MKGQVMPQNTAEKALFFAAFLFCTNAHLTELPESAMSSAEVASPDVYVLVAENDLFRVLLATWAPGQSDEWHSHHYELTNYTLTDCTLRGENPDGSSGQLFAEAGTVGFNSISTHKVTNVGESTCRLLIVERK